MIPNPEVVSLNSLLPTLCKIEYCTPLTVNIGFKDTLLGDITIVQRINTDTQDPPERDTPCVRR